MFTGNTASEGGGFYSDGVITLSYSIFNTSDTVSYYDNFTGKTKNFILDGNVIVEDPLLGALQNNGGPTLTMLPGAGSPAIDSGSNAAAAGIVFDQRGTGFARIANGTVDMGAVEVQGSDASNEDDASSDEGSSDGVGVNSLTTVLLKDQSGLDSDWSDHDIFLGALNAVLKEKPESKLKVLADGSVKLTAFLPTDRAFRKLTFDLTGIRPRNDKAAMRVIENLDIETIEKVLLYHVVLGDPIGSSDALKANGLTLTALSGETFSVRVTKRPNIFLRDNNKDLKNPKVLLKRVDINSGNRQVAHVINRVLIPIEDLK
jgi:predicted outer membrane repeat protein